MNGSILNMYITFTPIKYYIYLKIHVLNLYETFRIIYMASKKPTSSMFKKRRKTSEETDPELWWAVTRLTRKTVGILDTENDQISNTDAMKAE